MSKEIKAENPEVVSESLGEYEQPTQRVETEEDAQLRQLEAEYHRLSLIAAVLEQRLKIKQITDVLRSLDQEKPKEETKVKRVPTDY